ncbi:TRAP transporter permease [Jeotgalibacillus sp. S-D1]|uniref:TRAP transporter permease n=1 Tax=Jeotgalibacillus sp. S-D1 TaxID=2552189 RepID=UPI00105A3EF7|nr:TRAP transporter permease [Jeotgalibacillus sp. S-D1]TDL35289.1 TRAP transporter permease [Jeotgalibacillus sp. S-D1]
MEKDQKTNEHTVQNKEAFTEEQQKELLAKYDPEARTREYKGFLNWVVFIGLVAFSVFQIYAAITQSIPRQTLLSIHLGFALTLVFLLFPARKKSVHQTRLPWYDGILAAISIWVGAYYPLNEERIVNTIGSISPLDFWTGLIAILLVLEATRRAVGLPITVIASLFLAYAYFGPQMPGFLRHRGLDIEALVNTMFISSEGIFGTPLYVSATFIFLFLLFGAFLVKTGIGQYFNDLAVAFAGKRVGGPAKVAIFSSALQGTISGSSVANVVTSGSFTIPMMKRLGYRKEFAGGVEAAASTGGQLMPPIMGAAAFLMVEFIGGVTYWEIAKAATIPALLYFSGIWIITHFEAKRIGLTGLPDKDIPKKSVVLKKIYLLTPIFAVVFLLLDGNSIIRAALYSIVVTILVSLIRKDTRINLKKFVDGLADGARTALSVAVATACAGLIVGVVTRTGLGLKLANGLVDLSGGILLLTLFFTMVAAIILGMGSPTTANYVITATIAAPALILLDVPPLAAHLFVFYFGIVADITPPVALAAFAAAGVSGGEPIKTGVNAAKLAIGAFIIPYMFVLSPQLLLIDTNALEIGISVITALAGMTAIGAAVIGYWYRRVHPIERLLAAAAGLMLIYPEGLTDILGAVLFIALLILQLVWKRKDTNKVQTAQA